MKTFQKHVLFNGHVLASLLFWPMKNDPTRSNGNHACFVVSISNKKDTYRPVIKWLIGVAIANK